MKVKMCGNIESKPRFCAWYRFYTTHFLLRENILHNKVGWYYVFSNSLVSLGSENGL